MPTLSVSKVLKAHGQGEAQKRDENGEDERVYHFAKSVQRLCPCCNTCRFCNNMVPKFKHRLIIEPKDYATAASEGCHGCLLVTQAIETMRTLYSDDVAARIFGDPGACCDVMSRKGNKPTIEYFGADSRYDIELFGFQGKRCS